MGWGELRRTKQETSRTTDLVTKADARVWAQEFMRVVEGGATVDEELMAGWFANAIETGRTIRCRFDELEDFKAAIDSRITALQDALEGRGFRGWEADD